MTCATNFLGLIPQHTLCLNARARLMPTFTAFRRSSASLQKFAKIEQHGFCLRKQTQNKPWNYRGLKLITQSAADGDDIVLNHFSAVSMINKFYTCINEKNLKKLEEFISDDCCFEDYSFVSPIQGKKDVMHFYQQLTTGMGQNVKFRIEHVCQDDELTAGVNWHLEWKNTQIPCTRGCSFYEWALEGERLVIKKAQVVTESPIKPGGLALTLLKNVTAIFDDFPKFAEWFLKSPYVIIQFLTKIYTRFLAPFVNPLLKSYIKIWNFMTQMFTLALSMILYILKKYFQ